MKDCEGWGHGKCKCYKKFSGGQNVGDNYGRSNKDCEAMNAKLAEPQNAGENEAAAQYVTGRHGFIGVKKHQNADK